jgi:hypothetical protein
MHLRYEQTTGKIWVVGDHGTEELLGIGWAGNGAGKNNHGMQDKRGVGPLPVGWYSIGEPETASTGPYSLRLEPDSSNVMFGRDSFLIHGPAVDKTKFGQESRGCIIAVRPIRVTIHERGLKRLEVVE